ncbi:MAG: hypothetical protein ABEK84_03845, partial [Salinibacter sp.]
MPPSFRTVLLLFLGVGLATGCASTNPAPTSEAARAAALGTWKYEVEGYAPLDQGIFVITQKNGRLRAFVRDRRRGRFRARVDLHRSRLVLSLDDLRIAGYIEEGTFTGFLRRDRWGMVDRRRSRFHPQFRSAALHARRIRSAAAADRFSILDCESIL